MDVNEVEWQHSGQVRGGFGQKFVWLSCYLNLRLFADGQIKALALIHFY